MTLRTLVPVSFSLLALFASACAVSPVDGSLADEEKSTTTSALESGLSAAELENLASSSDVSAAARALATPEAKKGCRTRTIDPANPNIVHVKLTNCTGRLGRHVVNGEMLITLSANPDGSLHAEHESVALTIDDRPATRRASSDIVTSGDTKRIVRRGVKTGTNDKGIAFTKETDEVIVVDRVSRCRTINGSGVATFDDGRRMDTTIEDLRICENEVGDDLCPTGTVTHVNAAKEKRVVQRFDGSDTAVVDVSTRKAEDTTTWSLKCVSAR